MQEITEDFIEIQPGLWYNKIDGTPWSNIKNGPGNKKRSYLIRLTCKIDSGYIMVRTGRKNWLWHRLVFQHFKGFLPEFLDHVNNIRDDNRIENLKETNNKDNVRKCKLSLRNVSGYAGVSWKENSKKFQSQITVNGVKKYLGVFDDPKEAYKVYLEAKIKYHGLESISPLIRNT